MEICRVCREESVERNPLFHPCKCSGSMRSIHQTCLEEWLKVSGKLKCDICKYSYKFVPVYAPQTPERISITSAVLVILKRGVKRLVLYFRMVIALVVWLMWVPYVTAWTWKLFLNPAAVLEEQALGDGSVVFLVWLEKAIGIRLESLYIFESYLNLHSNLKTFLSIVFEGQIIAAVVVILGLVLLLLREFFLANVEEAPPPPPRPNFNVPVGRRRRLFQRGVRGDVVRNAEPVPQPEPQMIAVQPQPLEIEPEQRIRQFGERYKVLAQDNPNPTIIRGSSPSNRLPPSPMMPRDRFREEGETRRASVVSWDLQELQDQSNRSFSNQEQEHGESQQSGSSRSYQSGSSSSQQFIPSSSQPLEDRAQQGRYNLRPRPERVDNGWSDSEFSSSIILERTGRDSDISSRDEIREREVEMERERVRAERERLERERLERERQLRQEMLRQEAEAEAERERAIQEMIRDVAVEQDEPEQNLNANDEDINMVLNVGINDGEIVAQFELNNVNAFLDLVGVTGPIIKLVHSVAIVHLIVFVVLGMGVWIPYLAGHTAVWLFFSGLVPTVEHIIDYSIKALQALSDPIVEPIADLLLNLFNSSTAAIVEKNSTNFMDTVLRTIGANLTTEKVTYGPYHPNFFHAFQEDLSMVFLGYVFLFVLLLAYANQLGQREDPYLGAITGMARTINTQLMSATKIVMFILLEMMCFPLYCGILIDLCTLPIFSNHATIQSRIALFQDYPWMFVMVHWVIGSIFMFQFAMYVSTIRAVVRPGLMWFVRDPNDPEFNALREILRRPIKSQLRKLSIGALMYGFLTFSVLGAGIRFLVMTDYLVNQIIGPKSVFKMFPLRLEYFDGVSEIPFDLFFFHFILPQALKFVELDAKFKTVVKIWFVTVAKMLRLSHFLMGERVLEEEDFHTFESHLENGNVSVIDPITMAAPSKKGKSPATETVDEYGTNTTSIVGADNEWNDDIPMNDFSNDEKKTWIRVPNIDNIDIIPGEKMLIWMKPSDPVFGRANETPEEVARKWTKVFAPENFYPRIYFLLGLQWFSLFSMIPLAFAGPIVIGRVFFYIMDHFTTRHIPLPPSSNFTNPVLSARSDLAAHDFYNFFAGTFITAVILYTVYFSYQISRFCFLKVRRRTSIKRVGATRRIGRELNSNELSYSQMASIYWQRKGYHAMVKSTRIIFLFLVVGLIMPLLTGLVFDLYVITPLQGVLNRAPIVFPILDWSTGAMAIRIFYNVQMMMPERPFARLLTQVYNDGIDRMNMLKLTEEIFLPYIIGSTGLLAFPVLIRAVEFHFNFPAHILTTFVITYGATSLLICYFTLHFLLKAKHSFNDWLEHLKDDQYLIGRTLENIE